MLILNINGPINSGKSTVSKILVNLLPNATFIEVDELMSDKEEAKLGLSMQDGWAERQKRLNETLLALKQSRKYETVIFAYPIGENSYKTWTSMVDKNTRFMNITLAPSLEECLKNRGTRELDDWERNRIKEMYEEGYQNRPYSDFIINNDNQTPQETAEVIKEFIRRKSMATIHLIHGFMGFGKTTLSKELAKKYHAKHFAIDQVMLKKFGRNPKDFDKAYQESDDYIWQETARLIQAGQDVILDYGFWDKETRKKVQEKASQLTPNVLWHQLICDIEVAKQRVLKRTEENPDELFIDENCFNERLSRYQPITDDECLNVKKHISG